MAKAKPRKKPKPAEGFEGRRELQSAEVAAPYQPGRTERVQRNVRHDPLEHLMARRMISNAQKAAGDRYRELLDLATGSPIRAIDYERIRVDGSAPGEPITERQRRAVIELGRADLALGIQDASIVRAVIGVGESIEVVAERWAADYDRATGKAVREYVGQRFRDALSTLARAFGLGGA